MSTNDSATSGPMLGTTVDDVRRQNLSQVLRIAHQLGPVSRAELTRATGLNRSTIGGLVQDLHERGLVGEGDVARTKKVGRPSPRIFVTDDTVAVAVNPEVDAIDVAIVGLSGRVLHRVRYRNERIPSPAEFVNIVSALIAGMIPHAQGARVLGVGVALPGLVRATDGFVLFAPHLGWDNTAVTSLLSDATGLNVVALNDANCGAIAEAIYGSARGSGLVVYLNSGASGIGSGIVLDGRLVTGEGGHAGEFGHTLVNSHGRECRCGSRGCLETEVRRDLFLEAAGVADVTSDDMPALLAAAWGDASHPAHAELQKQVDYLGVAVRTIVNALNPRLIVLGGYLAHVLAVVGEETVKARVGGTLPGGLDDVSLVATELGDELLLIGAAERVFSPLLDDPTLVPAREPAAV
ncbi:ROK family transcriptional regulator [Microbacterium sp. NC79]|uniref:ROK family transcriptional regulator n=1 Tax=Microbacterium sp. NC79 TaxID=2851009 RepID=UPI001C2BF2DA|nr:ROK family transcriptional regulator [Microbacterium sp. NC79]MBV0895999.1 ROK family transcriptional regulator [Microbacterium sp. NC79]